jgi:cellobiose phosphorylase
VPAQAGHQHPVLALAGAEDVSYSLLPMTQAIIGRVFTHAQARHHLGRVRKHLLFSDGSRLMDKPIVYDGRKRSFGEQSRLRSSIVKSDSCMCTRISVMRKP